MFALLLASALAADWPLIQGTEPAEAPASVRPWGFVNLVGEGAVTEAPTVGLTVRRARLGLRGAAPHTDGHVSWLVAAELGDNGLTRADPVVLTDASITVSYVPGARVRVGQFKLPLGIEALETAPIAQEFVTATAGTSQLLIENPIAGGAYTGGAYGFRDIGVEVFDSFDVGPGALSYALMGSNGRMGGLETDPAKDLTGRVAWAPVVWGDDRYDTHREELSIAAFWQQGTRADGLDRAPRIRRGVGLQLERSGLHARLEGIDARGLIESIDPAGLVSVDVDGRAVAGLAFVHAQRGRFGAGLRYDELRRGSHADLRVARTLTADLQLELTPKARLLADYEARWLAAPHGGAVEAPGDRVLVQAGVVF